MGVFESGIHSDHFNGSQLFVDPKSGFSDDPDDVAQIVRRVELDLLLLGPTHGMWPEQSDRLGHA